MKDVGWPQAVRRIGASTSGGRDISDESDKPDLRTASVAYVARESACYSAALCDAPFCNSIHTVGGRPPVQRPQCAWPSRLLPAWQELHQCHGPCGGDRKDREFPSASSRSHGLAECCGDHIFSFPGNNAAEDVARRRFAITPD